MRICAESGACSRLGGSVALQAVGACVTLVRQNLVAQRGLLLEVERALAAGAESVGGGAGYA